MNNKNMQTKTQQSKTPPLWKLIFICSVASFCALLPADAVPLIGKYFNISAHAASAVLTWYLLGYGLGPLLYAPLSNRFGRKKSLLIGFSIALIGMLISLLSIPLHLFYGLLAGRIIAGIGASAGLVLGMVIINETAETVQARKLFSLIVLFFAFTPSLAMACGGYLSQYLGLNSIFIIMLFIILGLILIVSTIDETYQGAAIPIKIKRIASSYFSVLMHGRFILLALVMTCASTILYVFNGISPLIAINQLKISAAAYGAMAIIPSLGMFAGALLSSIFSKHYSATKSLTIGLSIIIFAALIMGVLFAFNIINLFSLLLPASIMFLGVAIVSPNASMTAISAATDPATASSLLSSLSLIASSLILGISGKYFFIGDIILPLTLLSLSLLGIALLAATKIKINKSIRGVCCN